MAVEESRLGIPLIFGMDVIHGYETIFPIPLALACSWDSACSAESGELSHVFRGMGFDDATVRGALRVSFGHGSQEGDVVAFLAGLKRTIESY